MIDYHGIDARGQSRTGRTSVGPTFRDQSIADLVERRYKSGWKSLRVTVGGDEAGGIGPHLDTGKRTWWGLRSRRESHPDDARDLVRAPGLRPAVALGQRQHVPGQLMLPFPFLVVINRRKEPR